MPKRHVFLHLGPDPIELDGDAREQLAAGGVVVPDVSRADLDRAALEIRRLHKAAGLRRKEVEGAWARVCRTTFRARADAFLSQPGFWQADDGQSALALDGLHGLKVHLVSTGDAQLPAVWAQRVKPERVHVIDAGPTFAAQVARLALTEEEARIDRSLVKLKKRRTRVRKQLSA